MTQNRSNELNGMDQDINIELEKLYPEKNNVRFVLPKTDPYTR